jgi:hypothetical protein
MQFLYNILQDIQSHSTSQSLVLLDEVRFKLAWKYNYQFAEKKKRENKNLSLQRLYLYMNFILFIFVRLVREQIPLKEQHWGCHYWNLWLKLVFC